MIDINFKNNVSLLSLEFGDYEWTTMKQTYDASFALANYLYKHDLCPKVETEEGIFRFVALYSKNREEWAVSDFAAMISGITNITLYDTLGKDSIDYILDQCYVRTVITSADKLKVLTEIKKNGLLKVVTHVIYFDKIEDADLENARSAGLTVISYADAVKEGTGHQATFDEVTPETMYTFSYTSGTTGMPKGVMLTHRNFVSNVAGFTQFDNEFKFYEDDIYISYLPLAHVFERCLLLSGMAYRCKIGFYQGDVLKLRDDLAVLKPTILISVPRLYNRFYDAMQAKVKELTGFKRTITEWGIQKKLANLEATGKTSHGFYDALVFNKFRDIVGGRVRQMITGSAPISKEVLNFLKIAFCCQINEGYGQTECGAPASLTWTQDGSSGHVGAPFPTLEMKLVDVPDMNYTSDDKDEQGNPLPRGEVCYRGYNCFKGYFRQPEQTKEAIDAEGWIHTGDIGVFQSNGTLKIVDRKKNIFKLSQGEYVQPEKLENKFVQSAYIAQCFVYGDSLQNNLVGIIVPDKVPIEKWAAANQVEGDFSSLIKNEKVLKLIQDDMRTLAKSAGFFGFEIPTRVHLTEIAFTAENEILTPTFKLKRNEAKKFFYAEIKNMYDGAKLQGEEK